MACFVPAESMAEAKGIAASGSEPALNVRLARVRMHHTDLMGCVYHGTYFDLFEDARSEMFRDLGYTYQTCAEEEGRLMVIARVACEYKRPAKMDDLLAITVTVPEITRARLTFAYEVRVVGLKPVAVLGTTVFAFLHAGTGRPTSVPPRLVALIRQVPAFGRGEPQAQADLPGSG